MIKWVATCDIKQYLSEAEDVASIVKAGHAIAKRLKRCLGSRFLDISSEDFSFDFADIVDWFDGMEETDVSPDLFETPDDMLSEFNYRLNELYDFADANKIWLGD